MSNPVFERIEREIQSADVVLFMKGVPAQPQCGFSATVVKILSYLGVPFKGVNILADPELRDNLKAFSQWPTFPQLYVKGELVGGCDIVREMFEEGELKTFLTEKGIAVEAA
jgi:monothiol glutaredoxin